MGDQVVINTRNGDAVMGEVVVLDIDFIDVFLETHSEGVSVNDEVILVGALRIAPHDAWKGRVIDANGAPLDGRRLPKGAGSYPLKSPPPNAAMRKPMGERLKTGMTVFDTFLPLVQGQRLGLFAGSGVGKSTLLSNFAKNISADVIVVAMIGERGRELRDFIENTLGEEGLAKSIIVAATSDQSAVQRRRCAWAAMAIAEYFRDQGQHVLLLADSITRFADAHREVALSLGEPATMGGYPPSVSALIMALCERAGPGAYGQGDITAIFSVLVAGSDMDEPVADVLRGVLDGHIVLDRKISERGRFPSVDVLRSVSRSLPNAATDDENTLLQSARQMLSLYDQIELMVTSGLYTAGSDMVMDQAISVWPKLDAFMSLQSPEGISESFNLLRETIED